MSNNSFEHLYAPMIEPGDLCFDVGANKGARTATFLALGAVVVAVEPQKDLILELQGLFQASLHSGMLYLIDKGLDAVPGQQMLHRTSFHTMATMSPVFTEAYSQYNVIYDTRPEDMVEVTTLDALIETFGVPKLCKIDVEGFDYNVLQGLSYPVHYVSFEYNALPELLGIALRCVDHLARLGEYEFNFTVMDNPALELSGWVSAAEMRMILQDDIAYRQTPELVQQKIYGDIFARNQRRVKRQAALY